MKKIGIMGGTFNPIHLGHIALADNAYKQFELDEVLFIPSGISYLKKDINVLDSTIRSDMVKLAIKDYPYFRFSDIEIKRDGNTYTCDTLEELHKLEEASYYFICGADSLMYIDKWVNPQKIFDLCTLLVAVRDESDIEKCRIKAKDLTGQFSCSIDFINMDAIDISSTAIRDMIKSGEVMDSYLPKEVINYIEEKGIYKNA